MPVFGQPTATKACEIRGIAAGTVNGMSNLDPTDNSFTWNAQTFAGFYYDLENDLGTESLKVVLSETKKLSGNDPYGITYTTTAQERAFEHAPWGKYRVIGFLGERYFAGYSQGVSEEDGSNIFYAQSTDSNSLSDEQLEKILIDSHYEETVVPGTSLKLQEGYELVIKEIDTNGVHLELAMDGYVVDSKVIPRYEERPTEINMTYYYKNPSVGTQNKLVTIGVHFKNIYVSPNNDEVRLATVDGIWQISETPTEVKVDTQYGKMRIATVDAYNGVITMDNKDNVIVLNRSRDIILMPGFNIRTASNNTLRFYIYSEENCECE